MKPSTLFSSLCLSLFTTAASAVLQAGDAAPDFTVDAALGAAEHPFATLKMRMGATHILMKRLPKVASQDRQRLNGYVQYVVQKGSQTREDLLQEVGDRIASCLAEVA